jgi:ubiquinone/menaquinone biosynthesis C-methylase UbiE
VVTAKAFAEIAFKEGDPMVASGKYVKRLYDAWKHFRLRWPPYTGGTSANRYAMDWNTYSKTWDTQYGHQHAHLGDEWNDDRTAERKRDSFYFSTYADRWIAPGMTALEVGPGGGKWTVRIAPRVKHLIVLDVAEEMLRRTEARCRSLRITNVEYVLANGRDFQPIADESIDFFFSYDVFVHIALEDTWPYAQEIARILAAGGRGACHYAISSVPEAWDRIEQNNEGYRGGKRTIGQYYYFSQEALRRMYERCGLSILEQHQEGWHCTCIFERPAMSIVPRLETLLKQLISQEADDEHVRATIVAALQSLQGHLEESLSPLLVQARKENDLQKRHEYAAGIRSLWRGV